MRIVCGEFQDQLAGPVPRAVLYDYNFILQAGIIVMLIDCLESGNYSVFFPVSGNYYAKIRFFQATPPQKQQEISETKVTQIPRVKESGS